GVNEAQKVALLPRLRAFLGTLADKVVAVWGLAFKPRTDDMREAPALALIQGLIKEGASVRAYDPKAMSAARQVLGEKVTFTSRGYDAVEGADALVVATEWNEFREPDFQRIRERMRRPAIFDGRNLYNPQTLRDLGFHYEGIGRR
ncbi:MAG TPA: UDP binding domain-containing protein, partial [Vicinamibacteria bacterium]|nr:UDP binding domain-containing protein [Vicinamibacteria bacterium]